MTLEERLAQALREVDWEQGYEPLAAELLAAPSLRGLRELVEASFRVRDTEIWMDDHMSGLSVSGTDEEWQEKYRELNLAGIAEREAVDAFRGGTK